jgi:MinD-like ATPase involved in chromosome partitioning or flagellar assembly
VTSPLTLDTLTEFGGQHTIDSTSGKLPFGPRLLAAPESLDGSTRWEADAIDAFLQKVASTADHVIVDTTPALPELLKAAVARAWFTLLVVERELVSIQLAAQLAETLAENAGHPKAVGAALTNHMPFIDAAPLPTIRTELNCGIVSALPPAREILHSYRRQGPIVLAQPEAPISVAFDELASRLDHDPVQFLI